MKMPVEMSALIGEQRTHKLFEMVKSTKYDFSMRLYSKQYCEYYILKHEDYKQPRILALELGYSLRFVQDVIKEKRCLPTNYDEEIVKMNQRNLSAILRAVWRAGGQSGL